MGRKQSSHLLRTLVEGMSSYSPYRGAKLLYSREKDFDPTTNVDLITVIDIKRAIKILYIRKELSEQEILMLSYVIMDGRLSRRDISAMIEKEHGYFVDQRTISRRLDTAYGKLARFLGFEFQDTRIFRMVAKKGAVKLEIDPKPYPYILSEEEIDKVIQIMERT